MPSTGDNAQQHVDAPAATVEHVLLAGGKRKEPEPPRKKPSFKAIGHLVMAMRRFSDSINPTYTYGKRTSSNSGGGSKMVTEDAEAAVSSHDTRPTSPDSNEPKYAYSTRGHKFDFLIKPLPATEDEEVPRQAPLAPPVK